MTNKITEDPRIDPRIKEQWKDINKVVDEMTIEIISYYDTPGTNICGLQKITFFGKDIDETTKGNS